MRKPVPRLFFYTSDLVRISGKCDRTCRRVMRKMKEFFHLEAHQELTYHQASQFLKIPADQIFPYIRMFPFLIMLRS